MNGFVCSNRVASQTLWQMESAEYRVILDENLLDAARDIRLQYGLALE